jgi:hypothetical protein
MLFIRLPDRLIVTFPDGDEVKNDDELRAGATIGLCHYTYAFANERCCRSQLITFYVVYFVYMLYDCAHCSGGICFSFTHSVGVQQKIFS